MNKHHFTGFIRATGLKRNLSPRRVFSVIEINYTLNVNRGVRPLKISITPDRPDQVYRAGQFFTFSRFHKFGVGKDGFKYFFGSAPSPYDERMLINQFTAKKNF